MWPTIIFGILFGIVRVVIGATVTPSSPTLVDVFKDAVHLYMGGLFVAWRFQKTDWQKWLFWSLCALEVAVAALSRMF